MIIKRLKRFVKIKWMKKSKRRTRIAEKPQGIAYLLAPTRLPAINAR